MFSEEIKNRLTAREVFSRYGFIVNTGGFCRSPFSEDNHASLKVYDGKGGWHCFSTNQGGSVIDFVMRYFDLPFKEACKKLNDDFDLGLPIGRTPSEEEERAAREAAYQRRQRRKRYEAAKRQAEKVYNDACDKEARYDKIISKNENAETLSDEYIDAIKHIETARYFVDCARETLMRIERGRDYV